MKNKKTFVGIALLIVVLILGIAYAATTVNLQINGTASANFSDANYKVAFTGETTKGSVGTVEATAKAEATSATLNVSGLTKGGEVATATFKVKNYGTEFDSTLAVTTSQLTGENKDYFAITTSIPEDGKVLSANEETIVTVSVELVKAPISEVSATIDVDLTATAQVKAAN